MKRRLRLPIPFAVLAAACTTGCCSFCIRPPEPDFFEGVHEAYSTDRDPAFTVGRLATNPAVDRRVDRLENWRGSPDFALLEGARWRARRIRPEDYPDADEISLLEWEETGYWTNGTYATQWMTLSKILTQRGLENNRTFSFSNDDFYGSATVLVARVHSPDGSRRDIDLSANLAEAIDTGSLASNIHDPNEKTFTLALPGLQVGDTVELSILRHAKRPRCEGVFADYLTFESDHPSLLQVVRITGPASMPLRSRAFRDAGPVSLEHAAHTNDLFGTVTEVWSAGETPRFFAEPNMPPAYDCTARLLLSTAPDWESLSRWYARLCAPHLAATNAAMALKVAELVASATSSATGDPSGDAPAVRSEEPDPADSAALQRFRELDPEARLEEVVKLGWDVADERTLEAQLRESVRSFGGSAPAPAEAEKEASLDLVGGEEFLRGALEALPENERDPFLERLWAKRRAESRRLCDLIQSHKDRLNAYPMDAAPRVAETEEPANAGEAGLEPANLRTRADDWTPAERASVVRALFDFVSREVRYMGAMAESEAPGYEPHDVSLTFDNRYGVCRDKAALLVAMLRMAGIDAWQVLINVGPRKDPQVPQPYFNHAIVAADSGDPANPYLLMDPTSETTRSLLPEYLCEMSYLVARDEGETIRETPPLPIEDNLLQANTVYTLNADASADVTTTLSFAGVNDAAYRNYFASIPRDGLRAFFERVLQGIPGAVLTGWEVRPAPEALRTSAEPLFVKIDYTVAEAARGAEDGRAALLDLPTVPAALAIASRVVGNLGLEKRRFPLDTDYPCGWEETVELRLPEGVGLAPQPDVRHEASANLFVDTATNAPSGAPGRYRAMKLFRSRYSPEEYGELRAAREAEERARRAPLRLEGSGVAALFEGREFGDGLSNALVRAVEPAPTDDLYTEFSRTTIDVSRAPDEWTVESTTRRRILTYAGQRKSGDLTFKWNPATSDFEVVDARVIAPDGTETPVNPALDLFTGDQEWVADAPRYPAGKLATVSFPKLAPGMSVQWTTRRRAHDRDLFSFSETLGTFGSFGEIAVTVVGTNDVARSFRIDDPFWKTIADRFPVETNETDGATTYLVRGGGPGSQIVSEPNMPPLHRLAPVLRASSQTAPERARAIADRMWELSDPAVQTNAAALARSLVPKGFDPNARRQILWGEYSVVDPGRGPGAAVFAIRDWCAVNLREAGPAYWDLPLSALSPADATLAARYGHEADIRILQLAMLRALGLCEGFGLFGSGTALRLYNADWDGCPARRGDLGFAAPATFDTLDLVVSEATWGPLSVIGTCFWSLDGATQYAPPLACRNEGRAHLFLRLPPSGVNGPNLVPVAEADHLGPGDGWGPDYPAQSGTETEYTIRVREDGSATIGVAFSHSGTYYEAFRKRYEEILPEERRRDAQRLAASIAQSAKLQGDVMTETPSNGPCTRLLFAVEVPDFAVRDGDRLVFRLPGALPISPQARERRFPFRRAFDGLSCTSCSVWLPDGWRVAAAPPPVRFGDPATNADYAREIVDDEGARILRVRTRRRLERAEFDAALFPAFQRDALRTHGPDAETVVLEKRPAEPLETEEAR